MGKTRKSFYAVRVGREVGVYNTWAECQEQVHKYPGAVFKGFSDAAEAQAFVNSSHTTHARGTYGTYSRPKPSHRSFSGSYKHPRGGERLQSRASSSRALNNYSTCGASSSTVPSQSEGYCTRSTALALCANEQECPVVYSDGCCFNNGRAGARAGIGVYWGHNSTHNISERLNGSQTNQRAELVSAYRAIQSAIDQGYSAVEVKTDSSYTIKAITEWVVKWKRNGWQTAQAEPVKNKEDIMRLDSACQRINVKWTHVPGHCGIAGNEAADQLAKAGSTM